jgi:pimeloyl-ACP methyl ester carboxylesterase
VKRTAGDEIRPFRLQIPEAELVDLHERLDRTRWPDELPDVGWAYGVPLGYLQELVRYWRYEYDWRAAEERLNEMPQFTTTIDGANVHFAHVRSHDPDAMPLLMSHGWPGSIVEFADVVRPLSDPESHSSNAADAFHLVLPSIPGFGLSGPTRDRGWEVRRVAATFAELMARLGYPRYGVHGGDWGWAISRELGRIQPDRVIGVHLTLISAYPTSEPSAKELNRLSGDERQRTLESWDRTRRWRRESEGYAALQSTRPQTLAYGLTDSPVGQLAWIVEKFKEWTDSQERPEDAVDRDQLLTNVMLYWLTRTAGSSARIYYEREHSPYASSVLEPSATPTAVAVFRHENFLPLRHLAEQTDNIVQWSEFERGGHFAAMEEPDLLIEDLRKFFHRLRHPQSR